MRLVLALAFAFALASAAFAATDPCARFADADAYNNCLAGAGPVAKSNKLGRAPAPDRESAPRSASGHAHSVGHPLAKARAPQGRHVEQRRNGRVRVEIYR